MFGICNNIMCGTKSAITFIFNSSEYLLMKNAPPNVTYDYIICLTFGVHFTSRLSASLYSYASFIISTTILAEFIKSSIGINSSRV